MSQCGRAGSKPQSPSAVHLLHVPSPLHLGVVMLLVSHCALFMQATQASATQMGLSAATVHWPEVRQGTQAPLMVSQ